MRWQSGGGEVAAPAVKVLNTHPTRHAERPNKAVAARHGASDSYRVYLFRFSSRADHRRACGGGAIHPAVSGTMTHGRPSCVQQQPRWPEYEYAR